MNRSPPTVGQPQAGEHAGLVAEPPVDQRRRDGQREVRPVVGELHQRRLEVRHREDVPEHAHQHVGEVRGRPPRGEAEDQQHERDREAGVYEARLLRAHRTAAWGWTTDSPAIPDAPPGNERRLEVRRPPITIRPVLVARDATPGREIGANGRASRVRALTARPVTEQSASSRQDLLESEIRRYGVGASRVVDPLARREARPAVSAGLVISVCCASPGEAGQLFMSNRWSTSSDGQTRRRGCPGTTGLRIDVPLDRRRRGGARKDAGKQPERHDDRDGEDAAAQRAGRRRRQLVDSGGDGGHGDTFL